MIWTIILFLVLLSVLVIAHECGHFFAAKKSGMKVEEFGLGFPPRLFSWKSKSGMTWSFNAIPVGGFVRIKGEDGENRNDQDSFASKSILKRFIVIVAGVVMNVVLAFVLLSIGFGIGLPAVTEGEVSELAIVSNQVVRVADILPDSPVDSAGIEIGDKILAVNGEFYSDSDEMRNTLINLADEPMLELQIEHKGEASAVTVEQKFIQEIDRQGLGFALVETGTVRYPAYFAPIKGAEATVFLTGEIAIAFADIIKGLFTDQELGAEIAGPIGIAVITGEMAQEGFSYLLQFAAILSINLAILNILPFPALDGGRIIFILLEAVRGKPASPKLEAIVHNTGFLILMLLVVVITFKDIIGLTN